MTEVLIVIDAPHFYAGLIAKNGREKGWRWEKIHSMTSDVDNA